MLPFLKIKPQTGVIVKERTSTGSFQEQNEKAAQNEEHDQDAGLMSAAVDMLNAIKNGDADAYANAFRAAFQLLELEPHEEVEHEQNE